MTKNTIKQHLEILPANLLPHRGEWQAAARSLPIGACLLVTNGENQKQTKFMLEVAQSFRKKGKKVIIWTTGQ